jgi:hypothetical protein
MIYLLEFLKGMAISMGLIAWVVILAGILFMANRQKKNKYEAEELIDPFVKYLGSIYDNEHYEQVVICENIIAELRKGNVHEDVGKFKIKKDSALLLDDDGGKSVIKIMAEYTVVSKI